MLYVICVRIASLVLLFALLEGIINCPKWLSLNNETMSQFIGPRDMILRKPIFPRGGMAQLAQW